MKSHKNFIVGMIILFVVAMTGVVLVLLKLNAVGGVKEIEVCTNGYYSNGGDMYTCEQTGTIEIIGGTEKITENYEEECKKYDSTPYFEVVGGFVGREFKGCLANSEK